MRFDSIGLIGLLAAASFAATHEPLKLDFTKHGKRTPARKLRRRSPIDVPLDNEYDVLYTVKLSIGTPLQELGIQFDTGSSNLWVPSVNAPICAEQDQCTDGAFNPKKSSSYKFINHDFYIGYYDPSDFDKGDYISETVELGGVNVTDMIMGLATDAKDSIGVMGVSFNLEEEGMIAPTILDKLQSGGTIDRKAFSIYLNDWNANTGSVIFGGIDTTKFHGELISLPMQPDDYSNVTDFSVALTSVSISDKSGVQTLTTGSFEPVAALLDSGTWDTELPTDLAMAIINGMGAVNSDEGYVVPCAQYENADATFIFGFGGAGGPQISVPISQMLTDAGFKFADGSEACSLGIDPIDISLGGITILGDTFLRSAYVVYDLDNLQIAMANTNFNVTSSNLVNIPTGTGLPGVSVTATQSVTPVSAIPRSQGSTTATGPASADTALFPGTPTFNLGLAASATAGASTSTSAASGAQQTSTGSKYSGPFIKVTNKLSLIIAAAVVGSVAIRFP